MGREIKLNVPAHNKEKAMGSDQYRLIMESAPSDGAELALTPASCCASSYRGRPSSYWSALLLEVSSPSGLSPSPAAAQRHPLGQNYNQ